MFVEHEVPIQLPVGLVERALIASTSAFEGLGEAAYRHGEELRGRVGPDAPIAKEIVVQLGKPRISSHGLAIPVTWRATGAQSLFPKLEGELEAKAVPGDGTVLNLRASYDPPFGWVGDLLDRLLLGRIAHLTVADWVSQVASAIENQNEAPVPDTAPQV